MRKLKIILFIILLIGITNNINAQELYGKWVLPTKFDCYVPDEDSILLLEFKENGIEYSILNTAVNETSNYCGIAVGGYNDIYNLEFFIFDYSLCYDNTISNWFNNNDGFQPEYQIIKKPGSNNEYYTFFIHYVHPEANDMAYNTITIDSITGVATASEIIDYREFDLSYASFAIIEEQDDQRYLYAASRETDGSNPADDGLHRWTISSTGLSDKTVIVEAATSSLNDKDFDAYNLEHKINNIGDDIIAWIHGVEDSLYSQEVDQIVVVNDGTPEIFDLNFGRIGGIEFSSINDSVLYASCTDTGIISLNYFTGDVIEPVTSNGEYGRSFLQTAPDGHIYAVSNNGAYLGRINMQTGIFEDSVFSIPSCIDGYIVSTYRIFDNKRYFILPENSRTYCPLSATVELLNVCPGYCDGEAWIDEDSITCGQSPYQYTWYNAEQQVIATDTNHIYNLCEGIYSVEIQDSIGKVFIQEFSIMIDTNLYDFEWYYVEQDEQWNNYDTKFRYGIRITEGNELEIINSDLQFLKTAKIIVEPGARLIVDNSKLSYHTYCDDKWKGIEVWGDASQHQFTVNDTCYQGYLELKNNSEISYAENGVALWKEEDQIWSSAGGILISENTNFINNTNSVHFVPYTNFNPNQTDMQMKNVSKFRLDTFDINLNNIGPDNFYKHADLCGVNGIEFYGCAFTNSDTNYISQYNLGIAAYSAGFEVKSACTQQVAPCPPQYTVISSFNGFYDGIGAYGSTDSYYTFMVNDADFENNTFGIYAEFVNNAIMIANDFEVGHLQGSGGDCDFNYGYGVDMQNAMGFAIEDNNFTKNNGAPSGIYSGIRVFNCPSVHDIIYRNSFDGLSFGNYAEGTNRENPRDDQDGVEYQCNTNTNNAVDFIVTDFLPENAMIRTDHGTEQISSANTFSPTAEWHFRNEGKQTINWFYCETCPNEEPEYIYTLDPIYFHAIVSINPGSCPDHYGGGGHIKLTNDERQQKELDYAENLSDYNSVVALYESLEDGGDTDAELTDVQTAQPDDMWTLRAQLLGHSPHLSQEVLRETSDRTDVFPDDVLLEILSANPDELKRDTLLSYLENKEDPLPDYMIDILRQVAQGVSYKTILKRDIAEYHAGKSQAAQDIIRSILCDTVIDLIQYRNWLDNLGSMSADKQIIASYLSEGDTANAMSLLNLLPSLYELEGDELDAYNDYKNIIQLQQGWKQAGINITELDSSNIAILNNYAVNSAGSAQNMAKNILSYAYNYNFCDCMHTNDSTFFKNSNTSFGNSFNKAFGSKISVLPNPARTWVAFTYELHSKESEGLIKITDISGKLIQILNVNGKQGQYIWDTRTIKSGVYFYTLISSGISKSGKLIIQ